MVYIHIPRTAGTSMSYALKDFSSDFECPVKNQHLDYKEYKKILFTKYEEDIKDYYVFTIIRNPWERVISHFIWHTIGTSAKEFNQIKNMVGNSNDLFFKQRGRSLAKAKIDTFDAYIKSMNNFYTPLEIKTQFDYLISDEGDIKINQIIKFENLMGGMHDLENKMGIKFNFPHIHRTEHEHYSKYFQNDEVYIKNFMELFKKDVEYFNYPYQNGVYNGQ